MHAAAWRLAADRGPVDALHPRPGHLRPRPRGAGEPGRRRLDRRPPRLVTVRLGATSNAFLPGHRIRIDLAGANFPRFARNPEKGTTTVHAPSYVVLPTVA
ncbi:hypothetical protein FXF51_15825 [Nonomuraea sp. PA05]|nr:hypothetical protein FXF51_15825 [Nonomuraea sp. PA05]